MGNQSWLYLSMRRPAAFVLLVTAFSISPVVFHFASKLFIQKRQQMSFSNQSSNADGLPLYNNENSKVVLNLKQISLNEFRGGSVANDKEALRYYGERNRLQLALTKLFSEDTAKKNHVRVASIGGSVTACHGIERNESYAYLFTQWLGEALNPFGVEVSLHNAAVGGSTSNYFNLCIEEHLDLSQVDILFVEFLVNEFIASEWVLEGHYRNDSHPTEQLIRTVLRKNPLIDIIFVNFLHKHTAFRAPQSCQHISEFHYFEQIASHYNLASISYKHLFCNAATATLPQSELDKLARLYLSWDDFHPSPHWHVLAANVIVEYVRLAIKQLTRQLRLERSTSELISEMTVEIRQQTESLLLPPASPLYVNTWLDVADCFLSSQRPFRNNTRLSEALTVSSIGFDDQAKEYVLAYRQRPDFGDSDDSDFIRFFRLHEPSSFMEFDFNEFQHELPCSSGYYLPRVVISYKMCNWCTDYNYAKMTALLTRNDDKQFLMERNFAAQFRANHFSTHYFPPFTLPVSKDNGTTKFLEVDYKILDHPTSVCWPTSLGSMIKHLNIRFTEISKGNQLAIHAISIAYHCCRDDNDGDTMVQY